MVEAILEGRANVGLMLERLERPLPAGWEEQREQLCMWTGEHVNRWVVGINNQS